MTKIKKTIGRKLLLGVLFVGCLTACFASVNTMKASAATTPKYTMTMSGTYYSYQYGSSFTVNDTAVTSVGYATSLTSGRNGGTLSLHLWGDSSSGSAVLANYGYINSKNVNISTSASSTISLYNSSGSKITSGSTSISASLSDGTYRVDVYKKGDGGGGYTQWGYEMNESSYFKVDTTAPTLSFSTTAPSGNYLDSYGFTVTASDSGSGVSKLYYKTPSQSTYTIVNGSTKTFSAGIESGQYRFYASDSIGNISATKEINVAASHVHSYDETVISPTCTSGGYTQYSCSCGSSYTDNQTSALGHSYRAIAYSGSCTSGGYTRYTCIRCGDSYTGNSTSALGHNYTNWQVTKVATCTESGTKRGTCSRCGVATTSQIAVLGHNYQSRVVQPTCVSGGYTRHSCTRCASTYTDNNVSALGHNYSTEVIEPTCTTMGCVLHSCSRCNEEYKTDIVPAYGHQYVTEKKEPTCIEDGGVVNFCSVCGYSYMVDIVYATGHSYSSEVVRAVTCTTAGERRHTCDDCGDAYATAITATGHNYQLESESKVDGLITRTYICTNCGHTYTEEVGEHYDMVSNFVVEIMNEYKPYMIWVFLATAGIWSIVMGIMIIIAKKNEDKEKAKKMLVNYIVGMVAIFVILVACPLLIKGIAALVT